MGEGVGRGGHSSGVWPLGPPALAEGRWWACRMDPPCHREGSTVSEPTRTGQRRLPRTQPPAWRRCSLLSARLSAQVWPSLQAKDFLVSLLTPRMARVPPSQRFALVWVRTARWCWGGAGTCSEAQGEG